jgi:alpha-tubulin suppressor-like RCC1 family protein
LEQASSLAAGGDFFCAVVSTSDNHVECWGSNTKGQLGTANADNFSTTPTPVHGLNYVTGVAAGAAHACALLYSGEVKCWGDNGLGQLGNGTKVPSATPEPVL